MILEIMVAAIIGISFGNAWTCIFMSFGTSSDERSVGKWFIIGRILGLLILGSVITLLRFAAQDAMPFVLLIFGVSTVLFGAGLLLKYYFDSRSPKDQELPNKHKKGSSRNILVTSLFLLLAGDMGYRGIGGRAVNKPGCNHAHNQSRGHNKKQPGQCRKGRKIKSKSSVFSLGVLRGATPCLKVIVLAPLFIAVGFPSALLLILVYALASTIYPVIGYLSADVLSKFERHQKYLKIAGALILITVGIYTLWKMMMWTSIHSV